MRNKRVFLTALLLILAFLYALPIFNKLWHAYDEGWILVNADLVSQGKIAYKDFWTLRPPGQFYILVLLFKIFGKSLFIGRIFTIVLHSLICFMVFLITSKLCRLRYALLSWFICMVSLIPRVGPIPWPVWPAIFFALISLMSLVFYIKKQQYAWLVLAGFFVSLVILFRHDAGIYSLAAGVITVFLLGINTHLSKSPFSLGKLKKACSESILFLAPVFIVLSIILYYFAKNTALSDLFNQLFYFPLKTYPHTVSNINFPKFCFNPNMLFHHGMYFINVNQFYIPIILILLTALLLLARFCRNRGLKREDFILVAIFLTGLFYLNFVRVRSDVMHLIPTMPFSIILFGYLLSRSDDMLYFKQHKYLGKTIAVFAFIFMGGFVIKNIDVYTKHVFRKPMQGKIKLVKFELGSVYIPKDDADPIQKAVSFIRDNTAKNEKIFVGNTSHAETQGTNTIIYFLAERLPATRYYTFQPGLTDQSEIQKEIIQSIEKEVNLVVLVAVPQTEVQAQAPLDKYLKSRFRLVKNFGRFYIYKKRI